MKTPAYADAQAIADDLIDRFESGQFDVAHLAYSEFKSVLAQEPKVDQIIPVVPAKPPRQANVAAAPRSNMSRTRKRSSPTLLPRNVAIQIYRALLENRPASTDRR